MSWLQLLTANKCTFKCQYVPHTFCCMLYTIYLWHFMVFLHAFWSLKAPIHDIGSERRDEQIIQNVSLLVGLEQQGA